MTKLITTIENHTYEVDVVKADPHRGEWQVRVNGELLTVQLPDTGQRPSLILSGWWYKTAPTKLCLTRNSIGSKRIGVSTGSR